MREFDRITVEYNQLGGLPHFRDTTITVSEVVRLVMAGTTNADILTQYPDLEPGDIQEALVYIIGNLTQYVGNVRFDTVGKFGNINQVLSFLLEEPTLLSDVSITEDGRKLLEIAASESRFAGQQLYNLQDWSHFAASNHVPYEKVLHLSEIMREVVEYLDKSDSPIELTLDISPDLAEVKVDVYWMEAALRKLITGEDLHFCNHQVFVEITDKGNVLRIVIRKGVLEKFSLGDIIQHIGLLAEHPTDLAIAALIIHQHGSELTITPDDEGVTFAFELPVWAGEED